MVHSSRMTNISEIVYQLFMHWLVLKYLIGSNPSSMLFPLLFESFLVFFLDSMELLFQLWFFSSDLPFSNLMDDSINGFFLADLLFSGAVVFVYLFLLGDGVTVGRLAEDLVGVEVLGVQFAVRPGSL